MRVSVRGRVRRGGGEETRENLFLIVSTATEDFAYSKFHLA